MIPMRHKTPDIVQAKARARPAAARNGTRPVWRQKPTTKATAVKIAKIRHGNGHAHIPG